MYVQQSATWNRMSTWTEAWGWRLWTSRDSLVVHPCDTYVMAVGITKRRLPRRFRGREKRDEENVLLSGVKNGHIINVRPRR